jgi:phenylpropionate dioxygenase-like ring-hydroxylating dioxygenase large terminal subunit
MAEIDHWHPVLSSEVLKDKPVPVRVAGHDLVLFRAGPNQVGALTDYCPHRRMRLSAGMVEGNKLRCRYHGWTYSCDGQGESPGTPKLHACAESFEAIDKLGAIWVKPRSSTATFPKFEVDGYYHMCTLFHKARAPLEVTADNFCEIEHTPTTHALFGYTLEGMPQVQVRFETTDTTVRVVNHGPPKKINWFLRYLLGITPEYQFNDDWTTHFSPCYSIYDHWWSHPQTGEESWVRFRLFIFFIPEDDANTSVITFAFTKSRWPGPAGGIRLAKWWLIKSLSYEIDLDVNILENLADKNPRLEGMKLSRFDRALGLNRERIERVYRGKSDTPLTHESGTPMYRNGSHAEAPPDSSAPPS